jgi:hypothetical protein
MLGNRKLVLDTFCEVYDLLKPYADAEFWNLAQHTIIPNAVYLIGREQFATNVNYIKQLAQDGTILPVLSNPAEGSETLANQCQIYGVDQLIKLGKVLLIGGGDMDSSWPFLQYESFLPKILDYPDNLLAINQYQEQETVDRPYKFLFLNGRDRPHRRYLLNRLAELLPTSLWTNLDSKAGSIHLLDATYECKQFDTTITNTGFIKHHLFNNLWGEIYLKAEPYLDTYFSLVTETVFDYPHSFRTEKIWKPIAIGHPFIVVANAGYYRDLHRLGFHTFGKLIDESFDSIENNAQRLERIAQVVEELCQQDLPAFVRATADVCKYNQQRLAELRLQVRTEFPQRFKQFINE